jgi:hypothetical protein
MLYFNVTMTDTFCGEANFAWVDRKELTMPADATTKAIAAAAKKLCRITGKVTVEDYGDPIELHPHGQNIVIFIEPVYL